MVHTEPRCLLDHPRLGQPLPRQYALQVVLLELLLVRVMLLGLEFSAAFFLRTWSAVAACLRLFPIVVPAGMHNFICKPRRRFSAFSLLGPSSLRLANIPFKDA